MEAPADRQPIRGYALEPPDVGQNAGQLGMGDLGEQQPAGPAIVSSDVAADHNKCLGREASRRRAKDFRRRITSRGYRNRGAGVQE